MKIGDYVRLDRCQGIRKIDEYDEETKEYFLDSDIWDEWGDLTLKLEKYDVVKFSPNIIDLIEVGDILYLEESDDIACMFFKDIYLVKNEDNLLNIISDIKNKKCKLISIVTKEQFESMEYKVGEK